MSPATAGICSVWRERTALAALMFCSLFAQWSVALTYAGFALVCLCFLTDREGLRTMCRHPLFRGFAIFAVYLAVRGVVAAREFPGTAAEQFTAVKGFLLLWCCFPFAWYLRGNDRLIRWVFLLMACGLLGGVLMSKEIFTAVLAQQRPEFHLHPVIVSLYSLMAVLGCLTIFPALLPARSSGWRRSCALLLGAVFFALLVETFLVAQTRSTWIAALIVFPPVIAAIMRRNRETVTPRRKLLSIALVLLVIAGLFAYAFTGIKGRFVSDYEMYRDQTVRESLADKGVQIPIASLSIRRIIYLHGIARAIERPLFGWGPGSSQYVMSLSDDPGLRRQDRGGGVKYVDHFHNFYLELMITCGFTGLLMMGGYFCFLGRRLLVKGGADTARNALLRPFFFGVLGLIAIWSLFDVRHFHFDFRISWLLVAGSILALFDEAYRRAPRMCPASGSPEESLSSERSSSSRPGSAPSREETGGS